MTIVIIAGVASRALYYWVSSLYARLRRIPLDSWLYFCAFVALMVATLFGLSRIGLLGPDEPRYSSIGREMARSFDWVTPRLWGAAWFEKPALLYWLIGLGHRFGLQGELAARMPVALCGVAFTVFLWWTLRRLGRNVEAIVAALLLASTTGWMAIGNVAATDMPLAASFNAALLCTLLWLQTEQRRWCILAGVFFGLTLLAKGLVGAVLFFPLLWFARKQWRGLALLFTVSLAVALPWYVAVTAQNGFEFIRVFFLEHHFGRFTSPQLQHVQPFWFYVPVLLGLLFPWTPALALLRRSTVDEWLERVCAVVVVFGFVFFSASTNKLPGYLLPLLPPLCIVLARAIVRAEHVARWVLLPALALSAALALVVPLLAGVLGPALLGGLRSVRWSAVPMNPAFTDVLILFVLLRVATRIAAKQPLRLVMLVALVTAAAWLNIKVVALPVADTAASARTVWRQAEPFRDHLCVGDVHRATRYGLNYYSVTPLPDCSASPQPLHIEQRPRHAAEIAAAR